MTTHMIDEEHEHGSLLGFWQKFFLNMHWLKFCFVFCQKPLFLLGNLEMLDLWVLEKFMLWSLWHSKLCKKKLLKVQLCKIFWELESVFFGWKPKVKVLRQFFINPDSW